jgi:hypothetical protein
MMAKLQWVPGLSSGALDYLKAPNETDVWELHLTRVILQLAGLVRKHRGMWKATKKAQALLAEGRAGELYTLLFTTCFRRFNLGYLGGWGELKALQPAIAFSFYVLSRRADDWQDSEALAQSILLPAVRNEIAALLWGKPETYACIRILEPLERFGLLEQRCVTPEGVYPMKHEYRKTPLFDTFLSFHPGEPEGPTSWVLPTAPGVH